MLHCAEDGVDYFRMCTREGREGVYGWRSELDCLNAREVFNL